MARHRWTEEELRLATAKNISMAGTLRSLGLTPKGKNYDTIRKYIIRLNIDISHFTGLAASRKPPRSLSLDQILTRGEFRSTHNLKLRLIKEGIFTHQCMNCKLERWMNKPIPLELEHIDGDNCNNELSNLQLLCPNCHALTPTYRGRNHGLRKASERAARPIRVTFNSCKYCSTPTKGGEQCRSCVNRSLERTDWPDDDVLAEKVKHSSFLAVGRELGVSDNAVRKRLRNRNILGSVSERPKGTAF